MVEIIYPDIHQPVTRASLLTKADRYRRAQDFCNGAATGTALSALAFHPLILASVVLAAAGKYAGQQNERIEMRLA